MSLLGGSFEAEDFFVRVTDIWGRLCPDFSEDGLVSWGIGHPPREEVGTVFVGLVRGVKGQGDGCMGGEMVFVSVVFVVE